jgi:hypothetical protein
MRIDSVCPFLGDVTSIATIVIRMCSTCQSEDSFRGVGDEEFLTSNAKAFSSIPSVNLGHHHSSTTHLLFT